MGYPSRSQPLQSLARGVAQQLSGLAGPNRPVWAAGLDAVAGELTGQLLVLVPHKGAHGTTTAVIQISTLSSNFIEKWAFKTELALITNSSSSSDVVAAAGLDAVAGQLTGQLLEAVRPGGTLLVYGLLGSTSVQANVADLLFRRKVTCS